MRKQLKLNEMPEEYKQEESEQLTYTTPEELRTLPHLEVYENHFMLAGANTIVARIWTEGKQTRKAHIRYQKVNKALADGFFDQKIEEAKSPDLAQIIEAKLPEEQRWLQIIDDLENGEIDANTTLLYVLQLLWKNSEAFKNLVQKTLLSLETWIDGREQHSIDNIAHLIKQHIERSETRARLLEVAIHSLLQGLEELKVDLGGDLKPLMPMRTANLKHGNLGDVEVLSGNLPIEAWDAKYDQPYLSDALEELVEKIQNFDVAEIRFGYILFPNKKTYTEVDRKIEEIDEQFGLKVQVLSFDEWVHEQLARSQAIGVSEEVLAKAWLRAYAESLGQKRRDQAPIDEPTFDWIASLLSILTQ